MAGPRERYAAAQRELLRDTVFDAAREVLATKTWDAVTMADVARAAGVSRQTLYNEFKSRDAFAQQFVLREGDQFITAVEEAVASHADDPVKAVAAAWDVFAASVAGHPVIKAVLSEAHGDSLLPLVTTQGTPLVELGVARLAAVLLATWPAVDERDAQRLAEVLVRLAISQAVLPVGPAGLDGAAIASVLSPHLEQLTSGHGRHPHG